MTLVEAIKFILDNDHLLYDICTEYNYSHRSVAMDKAIQTLTAYVDEQSIKDL